MRRVAWILIAAIVGAAIGVVLGGPWSCWQAECPSSAAGCVGSGCDNLLGMTITDTTTLGDTYLVAALAGAILFGAVVALAQVLMGRTAAHPRI